MSKEKKEEKSAGAWLADFLLEEDESKKEGLKKNWMKATEDYFENNGVNMRWGDKKEGENDERNRR